MITVLQFIYTMREFLDYDIKYPNLVLDIIDYFSIENGDINQKSIQKFITSYTGIKGDIPLQPDVIGKICDRLCEFRLLSNLRKSGNMCLDDSYIYVPRNQDYRNNNPDVFRLMYNSVSYGFEYIYRNYLDRVLPIVVYTNEGETLGTCFRLFNGLVTARHCLKDGEQRAIQGYTAEFLRNCKVYVSQDPNIDVAFIDTGEVMLANFDDPHILDEVLVMGYPRISLFLNFCTAEKANISSMAKIRMTPTRGSILAEGKLYYPKGMPSLLLITAKISGGNSGGPIINNKGLVVGVATGLPGGETEEGMDIGYGIAYPISVIRDIILENNTEEFDFINFPEE